MHYNYLCVIISGPDKKGKAGFSALSCTDSLISLMCGINIILSDIPELLVVCVARAMIQNCQTGGMHQSNSAHLQLICLPVTRWVKSVHNKYEAAVPFSTLLFSVKVKCHFSVNFSKRGNEGQCWSLVVVIVHKRIYSKMLILIYLTGIIEPL